MVANQGRILKSISQTLLRVNENGAQRATKRPAPRWAGACPTKRSGKAMNKARGQEAEKMRQNEERREEKKHESGNTNSVPAVQLKRRCWCCSGPQLSMSSNLLQLTQQKRPSWTWVWHVEMDLLWSGRPAPSQTGPIELRLRRLAAAAQASCPSSPAGATSCAPSHRRTSVHRVQRGGS